MCSERDRNDTVQTGIELMSFRFTAEEWRTATDAYLSWKTPRAIRRLVSLMAVAAALAIIVLVAVPVLLFDAELAPRDWITVGIGWPAICAFAIAVGVAVESGRGLPKGADEVLITTNGIRFAGRTFPIRGQLPLRSVRWSVSGWPHLELRFGSLGQRLAGSGKKIVVLVPHALAEDARELAERLQYRALDGPR